jgi:hypothetical protein
MGQTPSEDDGGIASLHITLVMDNEATLKKTDECVTLQARLIDNPEKPRAGEEAMPVEHSLTPEKKRVLTPDGLMTVQDGGVTLAEQPPEFRDLPVEVTVVTPFGSPAHDAMPKPAVFAKGKLQMCWTKKLTSEDVKVNLPIPPGIVHRVRVLWPPRPLGHDEQRLCTACRMQAAPLVSALCAAACCFRCARFSPSSSAA